MGVYASHSRIIVLLIQITCLSIVSVSGATSSNDDGNTNHTEKKPITDGMDSISDTKCKMGAGQKRCLEKFIETGKCSISTADWKLGKLTLKDPDDCETKFSFNCSQAEYFPISRYNTGLTNKLVNMCRNYGKVNAEDDYWPLPLRNCNLDRWFADYARASASVKAVDPCREVFNIVRTIRIVLDDVKPENPDSLTVVAEDYLFSEFASIITAFFLAEDNFEEIKQQISKTNEAMFLYGTLGGATYQHICETKFNVWDDKDRLKYGPTTAENIYASKPSPDELMYVLGYNGIPFAAVETILSESDNLTTQVANWLLKNLQLTTLNEALEVPTFERIALYIRRNIVLDTVQRKKHEGSAMITLDEYMKSLTFFNLYNPVGKLLLFYANFEPNFDWEELFFPGEWSDYEQTFPRGITKERMGFEFLLSKNERGDINVDIYIRQHNAPHSGDAKTELESGRGIRYTSLTIHCSGKESESIPPKLIERLNKIEFSSTDINNRVITKNDDLFSILLGYLSRRHLGDAGHALFHESPEYNQMVSDSGLTDNDLFHSRTGSYSDLPPKRLDIDDSVSITGTTIQSQSEPEGEFEESALDVADKMMDEAFGTLGDSEQPNKYVDSAKNQQFSVTGISVSEGTVSPRSNTNPVSHTDSISEIKGQSNGTVKSRQQADIEINGNPTPSINSGNGVNSKPRVQSHRKVPPAHPQTPPPQPIPANPHTNDTNHTNSGGLTSLNNWKMKLLAGSAATFGIVAAVAAAIIVCTLKAKHKPRQSLQALGLVNFESNNTYLEFTINFRLATTMKERANCSNLSVRAGRSYNEIVIRYTESRMLFCHVRNLKELKEYKRKKSFETEEIVIIPDEYIPDDCCINKLTIHSNNEKSYLTEPRIRVVFSNKTFAYSQDHMNDTTDTETGDYDSSGGSLFTS